MAAVNIARANVAIAAAIVFGAGAFSINARADQVIADDLIVDGSLCAGIACANGETFGTGTMRLKNGSVRLDFIDSSAPGVPDRDWRIEANAPSGAGEHFAIKDMGDASTGAEGGTAILQLTAGARANSIFVANNDRVGLGTATPSDTLHIAHPNAPAIRFDQTGSAGFPPRLWRIGGNDQQFFIQDQSSSVPLSVKVGAPNNSLVVTADGRAGFGTATSDAPLAVRSTPTTIGAGNAVLKLVNPAGPTALQMQPFGTGFFWNFAASDNDTFNVNRSGNSAVEMSLNGAGNLTISGTLTTGGPTCATGCDAVFDPDYALPSIEDHAEAMWEKRHLPNIGPTLPHQPVNLSEQYGRLLNELETAHIYIEQLHREKAAIRADLEAQIRRERDANEARFARLENAMGVKLD
jgi:hypothetical protein